MIDPLVVKHSLLRGSLLTKGGKKTPLTNAVHNNWFSVSTCLWCFNAPSLSPHGLVLLRSDGSERSPVAQVIEVGLATSEGSLPSLTACAQNISVSRSATLLGPTWVSNLTMARPHKSDVCSRKYPSTSRPVSESSHKSNTTGLAECWAHNCWSLRKDHKQRSLVTAGHCARRSFFPWQVRSRVLVVPSNPLRFLGF